MDEHRCSAHATAFAALSRGPLARGRQLKVKTPRLGPCSAEYVTPTLSEKAQRDFGAAARHEENLTQQRAVASRDARPSGGRRE